MPLPPIKTQLFSDPPKAEQVRRLQSEIVAATRPVFASPIVDGQLIGNITITTTKTVNHGLGRKLQGWIVVGKSANADVWDHQDTNDTPQLTLSLEVSAACTINLWVF